MAVDGLEFDRVSHTWITPEEMAQRRAIREERIFQRKASQGELAAPMIISDGQGGIRGVRSMADGQMYDSKSAMRRHYREVGVAEVGNDIPSKPTDVQTAKDPRQRDKRRAAIGKALSYSGLGAP